MSFSIRLPPIPPPLASKMPLFYISGRGWAYHWPRIPGHLMLQILKENLTTPRRRGLTPWRTQGYWIPSSLVCYSVGPPRSCEGLRHSMECFAAPYLRPLLSFSFSSLLRVFPLRYLASFFLIISPCPAKHYNMGD